MSEIKLFNRWESEHIVVDDPGLKPYISVKAIIVPKTGARYAGQRFHKSRINIVERLINKLMIPGHKSKKHIISSGSMTGKANTASKIVEETFKVIEQRLHKNPVEVFVKALENAAPREETIAIEYGGARYLKAVECAPQRRIDTALRYMVEGSYQKSFNSKNSIVSCLAEEIIAAFQLNIKSAAISKKNEMEKQADSSR